MAIASSDAEGNPSVRMVLLKGYDERGFVFYSNYDSRKGKELSNGKAALCMYWEPFQRSVSHLPSGSHLLPMACPYLKSCLCHISSQVL